MEEDNKDFVEQELEKVKGKRGFQKGNKLASKEIKTNAQSKDGKNRDLLQNARSTVLELLNELDISAAHEMIKAARKIKDPGKKFYAWRDIHNFIEGPRKSVDVQINKSEEKTINIVYKPKEMIEPEKRKPLQKVDKIVEAEFEELQQEILNEVIDE